MWEKHRLVASCTHPSRDWTCNLGECSENPTCSLSVHGKTLQTPDPHPARASFFCSTLYFWLVLGFSYSLFFFYCTEFRFMYKPQFIYSFYSRWHLGCFQVWTSTNNIAINILLHVSWYVWDIKTQNLFIKNCVFILTCLNFSHLQSTLHLIQYTYWDFFSTAQNRFWTCQFWCLLVLLPFFVSPLAHWQNISLWGLLSSGETKKRLWGWG